MRPDPQAKMWTVERVGGDVLWVDGDLKPDEAPRTRRKTATNLICSQLTLKGEDWSSVLQRQQNATRLASVGKECIGAGRGHF